MSSAWRTGGGNNGQGAGSSKLLGSIFDEKSRDWRAPESALPFDMDGGLRNLQLSPKVLSSPLISQPNEAKQTAVSSSKPIGESALAPGARDNNNTTKWRSNFGSPPKDWKNAGEEYRQRSHDRRARYGNDRDPSYNWNSSEERNSEGAHDGWRERRSGKNGPRSQHNDHVSRGYPGAAEKNGDFDSYSDRRHERYDRRLERTYSMGEDRSLSGPKPPGWCAPFSMGRGRGAHTLSDPRKVPIGSTQSRVFGVDGSANQTAKRYSSRGLLMVLDDMTQAAGGPVAPPKDCVIDEDLWGDRHRLSNRTSGNEHMQNGGGIGVDEVPLLPDSVDEDPLDLVGSSDPRLPLFNASTHTQPPMAEVARPLQQHPRAPDTSLSPAGPPREMMWYYQDPHGKWQGQFPTSDIVAWYEKGFFPLELPLRGLGVPSSAPNLKLGDVLPAMKMELASLAAPKPPPGWDSVNQRVQSPSTFPSMQRDAQMGQFQTRNNPGSSPRMMTLAEVEQAQLTRIHNTGQVSQTPMLDMLQQQQQQQQQPESISRMPPVANNPFPVRLPMQQHTRHDITARLDTSNAEAVQNQWAGNVASIAPPSAYEQAARHLAMGRADDVPQQHSQTMFDQSALQNSAGNVWETANPNLQSTEFAGSRVDVEPRIDSTTRGVVDNATDYPLMSETVVIPPSATEEIMNTVGASDIDDGGEWSKAGQKPKPKKKKSKSRAAEETIELQEESRSLPAPAKSVPIAEDRNVAQLSDFLPLQQEPPQDGSPRSSAMKWSAVETNVVQKKTLLQIQEEELLREKEAKAEERKRRAQQEAMYRAQGHMRASPWNAGAWGAPAAGVPRSVLNAPPPPIESESNLDASTSDDLFWDGPALVSASPEQGKARSAAPIGNAWAGKPAAAPSRSGSTLSASFPSLKAQEETPVKETQARAVRPAAPTGQNQERVLPQAAVEGVGVSLSPAFETWCKAQMVSLTGNDDLTLVEFLYGLSSPSEIAEYVTMYLGGSRAVSAFVAEFIKRKALDSKKQKKKKEKSEAVLDRTSVTESKDDDSSGVQKSASSVSEDASSTSGKKKKKKKRVVDPTLLGFSVESSRIMQGEILEM